MGMPTLISLYFRARKIAIASSSPLEIYTAEKFLETGFSNSDTPGLLFDMHFHAYLDSLQSI